MLKARVITAVVLFAIFIPIFFLLPVTYLFLALLGVMAIAAWEWGRFLWPGRTVVPWVYAGVVLMSCLGVFLYHQNLLPWVHWDLFTVFFLVPIYGAVFFWIVCVPFILKVGLKLPLNQNTWVFSIGGWFLFVGSFASALVLRDHSLGLFLTILGIVWCADMGAYFVGKKFGRHKLAITLSPGKSWEGALGGLVCVVLLMMGLLFFQEQISLSMAGVLLLISMFLAAMSVAGDLFESLLKRIVLVKDSSALLPGHGGVLDRIDGILPVLPIAALLLRGFS